VSVKLERIDVGRIERIHALRLMFGASGVSMQALAALAAQLDAVRIPKSLTIEHSGGPGSVIYFVMDGELEVLREGKPFGRFGPRSVVGGLAALAREPNGYSCTATKDTQALRLRFDDMLEVFEDHYELLQASMEGLAENTIQLRRLIQPSAGYDLAPRPDPTEPLIEPLGLIERMLMLRSSLAMHTHIDELAELARAAQEVHYKAGATLWDEGERATHMLVIVRGSVRAATTGNLAFRFGPADLVGALDTIAGVERWFSARAERPIIALALDRDALLDLAEDQAEVGFDVLRMLARILTSVREKSLVPANGLNS
jgi:CRP-like cAMP-binding protein